MADKNTAPKAPPPDTGHKEERGAGSKKAQK
jgi:hypothetical protein